MHTLLIVDDEDQIRDLLRRVFTAANYKVLDAANGNGALRLLQTHDVDAIITDISMPEKDGVELLRILRKTHPDIIKIVASGNNPSLFGNRLEAAAQLGIDYLFSKPFMLKDLVTTVNESLGDNSFYSLRNYAATA